MVPSTPSAGMHSKTKDTVQDAACTVRQKTQYKMLRHTHEATDVNMLTTLCVQPGKPHSYMNMVLIHSQHVADWR